LPTFSILPFFISTTPLLIGSPEIVYSLSAFTAICACREIINIRKCITSIIFFICMFFSCQKDFSLFIVIIHFAFRRVHFVTAYGKQSVRSDGAVKTFLAFHPCLLYMCVHAERIAGQDHKVCILSFFQ